MFDNTLRNSSVPFFVVRIARTGRRVSRIESGKIIQNGEPENNRRPSPIIDDRPVKFLHDKIFLSPSKNQPDAYRSGGVLKSNTRNIPASVDDIVNAEPVRNSHIVVLIVVFAIIVPA